MISSPTGAAAGGEFLAFGRVVSSSPNGLGIPPEKAGGAATNAIKPNVTKRQMRERMGPEGSLFSDFDTGHDFDFFLLLRLIFCRQDPKTSRQQPSQRTDDEQETEKARHFWIFRSSKGLSV